MKNPEIDIKKYEAYFHDGSVENLDIINNNIIIIIESAELEDWENEDNIPLQPKFHSIRGKLNLIGFSNLKIDGEEAIIDEIIKNHKGTILDLEFHENAVLLNVEWHANRAVFQIIECNVIRYFFENIPSLVFSGDEDFDDEGRYIGPKIGA